MKVLFAVLISSLALVQSRPGGYTAKGGVYDFLKELDYLDQAKAAGKFAWTKHFEEELIQEEAFRKERSNQPHIPLYFTSKNNFAQLTAGVPTFDGQVQVGEIPPQSRLSRQAAPQVRPLYYSNVNERHAGQ